MKFEPLLQQAILVKRYKRFLVDVDDGNDIFTIHCPNTGAMTGCAEPGSIAYFSESNNPNRKYRHTLELVKSPWGHLIGVNTHSANALIAEALSQNKISGLENMLLQREVKVDKSRLDFMLTNPLNGKKHFIEVKSVTLGPMQHANKTTENLNYHGIGYFPDAISTRAIKHLKSLEQLLLQNQQASLIFCVQHSAITEVQPATHIHAEYTLALQHARLCGVNIRAFSCNLSVEEIEISEEIPVVI